MSSTRVQQHEVLLPGQRQGPATADAGAGPFVFMPELLTARDVAEVLKVSTDTVMRLFGDRPGCIDLGSPEVVRALAAEDATE